MTRPSNPDFPDFEHSLPMLMLRAREAVMSRFRPMLRKFDLTEQQWRIIRALSEVRERDAGELAAVSYILAPSLTRILQKLESRGLVKRRSDRSDQRRVLISLTKKGDKLFQEVRPHSRESYAGIAAALGPERLSDLYKILAEVETHLRSNPSTAQASPHPESGSRIASS